MSLGANKAALMGAAGGGDEDFYEYQIEKSLRCGDAQDNYLDSPNFSAGADKKYTLSLWVKRGDVGRYQAIMGGSAGNWTLAFDSDDTLKIPSHTTVETSGVFRDTSAWYHIVVGNGPSDGDGFFYVNGVLQTLQTNNFNSNSGMFRSGQSLNLGQSNDAGYAYQFKGYVAEVIGLYDQTKAASDFGEFKNGVWVPKAYSSFGTSQDFYLKFEDSSDLGNDSSGNGNDFTNNNMTADNQTLDAPTFDSESNGGNFCVLNPNNNMLSGDSGSTPVTISNGALETEDQGSYYSNYVGTMAVSGTNKYYYEYRVVTAANNGNRFGWIDVTQEQNCTEYGSKYPGGTAGTWSSNNNGVYSKIQFYNNGSASSVEYTGASQSAGDIWCVGLDLSTGKLYFSKNAALDPSSASTSSASSGTVEVFSNLDGGVYAPSGGEQAGSDAYYNFGQDSTFGGAIAAGSGTDANGYGNFKYAPPTDYLAICAANLSTPAADPASAEGPAKYFVPKIYTGDGATTLAITGLEFQPDLTWIKNRDAADDFCLFDSTRGVTKLITSDTDAAETTDADTLKSFTSDGFTVGADVKVNTNTEKYVSWNWKVNGGTTSTNEDGSINSTVQVDATRGFSIIKYTGTGSGAITYGHGLGVAPEFIVNWRLEATQSRTVYQHLMNDGAAPVDQGRLYLDANSEYDTGSGGLWDVSEINTTTIGCTSGTWMNQSEDFLTYAFVGTEGFSKFGAYIGNGSTDGTFVYCGFRPALVTTKRVDGSSSWLAHDNARNTYNVTDKILTWDDDQAEFSGSNDKIDMLSNGFKIRSSNAGINGDGNDYIFCAWGANPFKYSLGF